MSEATARRWRVVPDDLNESLRQILGPSGLVASDLTPEHAALIVRAVNNFDALVEVAQSLDEFQREYEERTFQPGWMPGNDLYAKKLMAIVEAARTALRNAGATT